MMCERWKSSGSLSQIRSSLEQQSVENTPDILRYEPAHTFLAPTQHAQAKQATVWERERSDQRLLALRILAFN